MPRGFAGHVAAAYLGQVSKAHTKALETSRQSTQNMPDNMNTRERRLPFTPDDAFTGAQAGVRSNPRNIAVSQADYDAICRHIYKADDKMCDCLYKTAMEIEEMCQTSFILPAAVPGCLSISNSVKQSLGQFRALTEEAVIQARRFAHEMISIG